MHINNLLLIEPIDNGSPFVPSQHKIYTLDETDLAADLRICETRGRTIMRVADPIVGEILLYTIGIVMYIDIGIIIIL